MNNRTHLLALVVAIGLVAVACGDGPDDVGPASPGPTEPASDEPTEPAGSAVEQAALDGIAQDVVQQFELPGAALQVRVEGRDPTTAVAGMADVDSQRALTANDQLRIYSVTKAVTAVIVLQLAEEGTVDLDDPVTDWLPQSVIGDVPHNDRMTIRHLLTHSSGAADYFDTIRPGEQQPAFVGELLGQAQTGEFHWYTPQELIDFSTQFEPVFDPGTGARYSNTGYVLLGLIIEAATGNPVEDEMAARVLEPLALTDTYLETPDTANDYIPGYLQVGPGQLVSVAGSNASFAWAAGGLISTIHDFGRLSDALFDGELLTAESHQTMFSFVPDSNAEIVQWGMGVYQLETRWGPVHVTEGGAPGYTAAAFRFPGQGTTILGTFNRSDTLPAFEAAIERSLELLDA